MNGVAPIAEWIRKRTSNCSAGSTLPEPSAGTLWCWDTSMLSGRWLIWREISLFTKWWTFATQPCWSKSWAIPSSANKRQKNIGCLPSELSWPVRCLSKMRWEDRKDPDGLSKIPCLGKENLQLRFLQSMWNVAVVMSGQEVNRFTLLLMTFAIDLNFVAIALYVNFDLMLRGRKVHRFTLLLMLHFAWTWMQYMFCWNLCWRRGARLSWDASLMNRALCIWNSMFRWSPEYFAVILEDINPGFDDEFLQKSAWDVQNFPLFPQESQWV